MWDVRCVIWDVRCDPRCGHQTAQSFEFPQLSSVDIEHLPQLNTFLPQIKDQITIYIYFFYSFSSNHVESEWYKYLKANNVE